jgi:hypothetical protein
LTVAANAGIDRPNEEVRSISVMPGTRVGLFFQSFKTWLADQAMTVWMNCGKNCKVDVNG